MLMKSFETVYKELERLLIHKLPEYIEKTNKEHNDGIILKPFTNTTLSEDCIKTPSFTFSIEESEYSEKDRIIENTVFTVSLELKLPLETKLETILIWRYMEVINNAIFDSEGLNRYTIYKQIKNKIFIKVIL